MMAQNEDKLPYYEIPDYPEAYTSTTVAARMIDGLGFRYFWATEGLKPEDLSYKASASGRSSAETIEHLYGLSKFIRNNILDSDKDENKETLSFKEKRKRTLLNFKIVSDVLKDTQKPFKLEASEVPFWNIINGPIADAIWHCGQVVMLRRASGNPFNSNVSVFSGKLKK
ncbi:MAG: hypothetical protein P8K68_10805 [Algibacter sp.]|uniref:hypothetical protein n=1 Tax=Algibacter sp. TaxID=1872428 RepID=UPI002619A3DB|nr:hypothetical protein [Algibacter sp.]MDG1728381.1 hypothetical protein [Algibacter sp.]MDG2179256.1 hypothetical protein [Algibacter sp.]